MQTTLPEKVDDIAPELLRELLDYNGETGELVWRRRDRSWFATKRHHSVWNAKFAGKAALNSKRNDGYVGGKILRKPVLAHRVIWAMVHGCWPNVIDHINHNRTDNRIENLRSVTQLINGRNQELSSANTSGRSGVHYCRVNRRWIARWRADGVRAVRTCKSFEEACAARDEGALASGYHPNHGKRLVAA